MDSPMDVLLTQPTNRRRLAAHQAGLLGQVTWHCIFDEELVPQHDARYHSHAPLLLADCHSSPQYFSTLSPLPLASLAVLLTTVTQTSPPSCALRAEARAFAAFRISSLRLSVPAEPIASTMRHTHILYTLSLRTMDLLTRIRVIQICV